MESSFKRTTSRHVTYLFKTEKRASQGHLHLRELFTQKIGGGLGPLKRILPDSVLVKGVIFDCKHQSEHEAF
jgi:hypothetical protein